MRYTIKLTPAGWLGAILLICTPALAAMGYMDAMERAARTYGSPGITSSPFLYIIYSCAFCAGLVLVLVGREYVRKEISASDP